MFNRLNNVSLIRKLYTPLYYCRVLAKHQASCPATSSGGKNVPVRGQPGAVRMGFLPEEWFQFFHSKTGVTGPYVFGFTVSNYLISKEIYVMEHEYYSGLSWLVILIVASKKLGPSVAAALDKDVDEYVAELESSRKETMDFYETTIKEEKLSQFRAEGQKVLFDAKKENVSMQLEAIYRERCMHVYRSVKNRMDYHMKRYQAEARIHQKWMIGWILENVKKSITPEFEKAAFDKCIQDLTSLASRAT